MDVHKMKSKVYIEFDIIRNSNITSLKTELGYLIGLDQYIIIWSKTFTLNQMIEYCTTNDLLEYIWDYKLKDACFYSSIDILIDNNKKLVDMFIRNNKKANYIERIE